MEKILLENSSPTLLREVLQTKITAIKQACNVFRCKDARLSITVTYSDTTQPQDVILLSELPEELRRAFHDYATRLISERHQIERQLIKLEPCTSEAVA